jgi:hypothetical protein
VETRRKIMVFRPGNPENFGLAGGIEKREPET